MSEQVLGVPRALLDECCIFQGFTADISKYWPLLQPEVQTFYDRKTVETDESVKQLIPYVLVCRNNRILVYRRGAGVGESRLKQQHSIGVGGHINPVDDNMAITVETVHTGSPLLDAGRYARGMLREVTEELNFTHFPQRWDIRLEGLLNDDSDAVGRVHLGVVHVLRLPPGIHITANEADMCELDWITYEEAHIQLAKMKDPEGKPAYNFESWTQLVIPHLPFAPANPPKKVVHSRR